MALILIKGIERTKLLKIFQQNTSGNNYKEGNNASQRINNDQIIIIICNNLLTDGFLRQRARCTKKKGSTVSGYLMRRVRHPVWSLHSKASLMYSNIEIHVNSTIPAKSGDANTASQIDRTSLSGNSRPNRRRIQRRPYS